MCSVSHFVVGRLLVVLKIILKQSFASLSSGRSQRGREREGEGEGERGRKREGRREREG